METTENEITGIVPINEQASTNDILSPEKTLDNFKDKGGRPKADEAKTEERREFVMKALTQRGMHNYPYKAIATQWEVSEQTIYSDVAWCLERIPVPEVEKEAKGLMLAYKRAISQAFILLEVIIPVWKEPTKLEGELDKDFYLRRAMEFRNYLYDRDTATRRISEGIRMLLAAGKEFMDFLERFGYKAKIADKIEIKEIGMFKIFDLISEVKNEGGRVFSCDDFAEK